MEFLLLAIVIHVDAQALVLALVAAIPAIIAAFKASKVKKHTETSNGKTLGQMVEDNSAKLDTLSQKVEEGNGGTKHEVQS